MTWNCRLRLLAALSITLLPLSAQNLPDLTEGFTPPEVMPGPVNGGYPLADIGNVSLFGGKLGISLPLRTISGRGSVSHTISVPINQTWTIDREQVGGNIYENAIPSSWSSSRPGFGPGTMEGRYAANDSLSGCPWRKVHSTLSRITFIGNGEGEIELRDAATNGEPQEPPDKCSPSNYNRGKKFISADGSGYTFISDSDVKDSWYSGSFSPSGTLYLPNGNAHTVVDGAITRTRDRNGNYMDFEYDEPGAPFAPTKITDSIGRETTIEYDLIHNGLDSDHIRYTGEDGASRVIIIHYDEMANLLDTGSTSSTGILFNELNSNDSTSFNPRKVADIQLQDGRKYRFTYNKFGEVVKVILPTDARIEYDWDNGVTAGTHGGASTDRSAILRNVEEVRTYLDETTSTVVSKTRYSRSETTDCQPFDSMEGLVVTVDRYDGSSVASRQKHYFCGVPGENPATEVTDYAWWKRGRKYKLEEYDGTSTLVKSLLTTFEQRPPNPGENIWWPGGVNATDSPTMETRELRVTTTIHQGGPIVGKKEFTYDQHNNRTDVHEYDWDDTTPSRRTHLEYETSTSYIDAPQHLRGLVTKQWICGAGTGACTQGAAAAQSEYLYDGENLSGAGSVINQLSPYNSTSYSTRGNLTKIRRWRDLPTEKWIESRVKYDTLGNAVEAIDELGNSTTVSYTDDYKSPPLGTLKAFPTSTTRSGHTARIQYEYNTGQPSRFTDINGIESTYEYNDSFDRMTDALHAANDPSTVKATREREIRYNDTGSSTWAFRVERRSDQYLVYDEAYRSYTYYDAVGRQVASRSDACSMVVRQYDGLSRPKYVGSPVANCTHTLPAVTSPRTKTLYDGLDRVTSIESPGGATTTTVYSGNTTTITDAAGASRQLTHDFFNQLVKVVEDPGGLNISTDYSYDALGNLEAVHQSSSGSTVTQDRTFTFDSLGRRISSDNPESSGISSWTYDDAGRLATATDSRGVTATFAYDALGRLLTESYSDTTPTNHHCYDGLIFDVNTNLCVTPGAAIPYSLGRLTSEGVEGVSSTTSLSFDAVGRTLSSRQKVYDGSVWREYDFQYGYNLDGTVASKTYPSGKSLSMTYNSNGRIDTVQENGGEIYVLSTDYNAFGAVSSSQYGNFLWQQTCFNDRHQYSVIRFGSVENTVDCSWDTGDKLRLGFSYGLANANNGNLIEQSIKAGSAHEWTQYYEYDATNRLIGASENQPITGTACPAGATWCRLYDYDQFGNRWVAASLDPLHMATPISSSAIDSTRNRLSNSTGAVYDSNGNLTYHPWITLGVNGSMSYDGNNRLKSYQSDGQVESMSYDARGRRVRRTDSAGTTIWVYDARGQLSAEYTTAAPSGGPSGVLFRTADHAGSTRLITDSAGSVIQRRDFFPFGEAIPASAAFGHRDMVLDDGSASYNTLIGVDHQFAGQLRDKGSGLDYVGQRFLSGSLGRFLMVDPGSAGVHLELPQSWNGYSYVLNNPLRFIDPDGRSTIQILPGYTTWDPSTNTLTYHEPSEGLPGSIGSQGSSSANWPSSNGLPAECDYDWDGDYCTWAREQAEEEHRAAVTAAFLQGMRSSLPEGISPFNPVAMWFVGFGELFFNNNMNGAIMMTTAYVQTGAEGAVLGFVLRSSSVALRSAAGVGDDVFLEGSLALVDDGATALVKVDGFMSNSGVSPFSFINNLKDAARNGGASVLRIEMGNVINGRLRDVLRHRWSMRTTDEGVDFIEIMLD